MEHYRLDSIRATGRRHRSAPTALVDGSDPWRLSQVAAAETLDLLFVASATRVQAYHLPRGRDLEFNWLDGAGATPLDAILRAGPAVLLRCEAVQRDMNALLCGRCLVGDRLRELLVAASDDGRVLVWDLGAGGAQELCRQQPVVLDNAVSTWSLALSPAHDLLAAGSNAHTIGLFSMATGQHVRTLRGHTNNVPAVRFSACGRRLVSGSVDGSCAVWDVQTGELLARHGLPAGQWGWGVLLLDAAAVETKVPALRGAAQSFRDQRSFGAAEPDEPPGSSEEDYAHRSGHWDDSEGWDEPVVSDDDAVLAGLGLAAWLGPRPGAGAAVGAAPQAARSEPAAQDHPRVHPAASYEVDMPTGELVVCTTQRSLRLFAGGAEVLCIEHVLQAAFGSTHPDWNVWNRERLCLLAWVPELSLLIAGSQCGSLALVHLTRSRDGRRLRVALLGLPVLGPAVRSLRGLAVRSAPAGRPAWEVYLLDVLGRVRVFRVERDRALAPACGPGP